MPKELSVIYFLRTLLFADDDLALTMTCLIESDDDLLDSF
jgi:hypothetical protein